MAALVGIVADDLTGAIDAAGPFAARGLRTLVSISPTTTLGGEAWEVLSCNTHTRNVQASRAEQPVQATTRFLAQHGFRTPFKKIDSTLRGHPGLEISAAMQESGAPYAFVVPAFPAMGRTVRDGVLYVDGVPLTEANEGSDPLSQPSASSVVDVLERQVDQRVGLVRLSDVDGGEAAVAGRIDSLLGQGRTWVAFDSVRQEDLERIEAVLRRRHPDGLLAGSAGLASAVAKRTARRGEPREAAPAVRPGAVVVVSGSVNPTSFEQIELVGRHIGARYQGNRI